jgi:hypothetical protein
MAMKATMGRSDVQAQREARKSAVHSCFLPDDADALHLTGAGYEAFVERTAARILNDCRSEVFFNRCPKCGGLARTPTARQRRSVSMTGTARINWRNICSQQLRLQFKSAAVIEHN